MPRITAMRINCEVCNEEFKISPSRFKNNKTHTCSKKCGGVIASSRGNKVKLECPICSKTFYRKQSIVNKTKNLTCSYTCSNEVRKITQKGSGNNNYKKRTTLEEILVHRLTGYRGRAAKKCWDFDLDLEFLKELLDRQNYKCYYSGIKMKIRSDVNKTRNNTEYNVMSLDRLDSEKGYTRDNVVWCCNALNMLKSNNTEEEFLDLVNSMRDYNTPINVKLKLIDENSKIPTKNNITDVGYDLYARKIEDCGNYIKVFTGVALSPEQGFYFQLAPRSSTYKKGLILYNSLGIIDPDFVGEILAVFYKTKDYKELPKVGDRLVQAIPMKMVNMDMREVEDLGDTLRGDLGFGSSGD